jgi:hypothetical protein
MTEHEHKALQQLAAKIDVLDEAYTHLALRYEEIAARPAALEDSHPGYRHDA